MSTLFQSAPLREGRQRRLVGAGAGIAFQSAPLREGRQVKSTDQVDVRFQSAPLREGRQPDGSLRERNGFNPRPCARGDRNKCPGAFRFNPRPCARGDRPRSVAWGEQIVSIRAPARGATAAPLASGPSTSFQSAPLREGRPSTSIDLSKNRKHALWREPRRGRLKIQRLRGRLPKSIDSA